MSPLNSRARDLLPVQNCLVLRETDQLVGIVQLRREGERGYEIAVRFKGAITPVWVPLSQCRSGFSQGMYVVDGTHGQALDQAGEFGRIVSARTIGGRDQHLVDFIWSGERRWVPFENLRYFRGIKQRFERLRADPAGAAERFRLRNLAYALENWHQNTGSLSRLEIDPLPHQIHLVHHILKSGSINWLIADDVGLGKTVETGMLISALRARGGARRVLLICPAGLVGQWKEEMHVKFALSDFAIYGEDFQISEAREWKRYDCVIASLDLAKISIHVERLVAADPWDLIVFDEAHRLSRSQWGMKVEASDRFRLAARLRSRTSSMILLSATPHQGRQDKFQALLELLRPDWKKQIEMLSVNPWILKRTVIRNNKADVTDAEGNFIFKGKQSHTLEVDVGAEERRFDAALRQYLEKGYGAARLAKGVKSRAIGFVMTVYRKLSASSIAAIESALRRRLDRLSGAVHVPMYGDDAEDNPFSGEWEEKATGQSEAFFADEISILKNLLELAVDARRRDSKIEIFKKGLVKQILVRSSKEKILVFTEYRATQEYVADELRTLFGEDSVALINGGMSVSERKDMIYLFENSAQFLVSTEAGGEGINLQRCCNVMINYDLPWNPMRLVQRVGRLYRYGQARQVVVFNIKSTDTLDGRIVDTMYARIQSVVEDLKPLGGEFRPGLEEEIIGQLVSMLDVESILEDAQTAGVLRTQQRISDALRLAMEAVELQRDIFEGVVSFDPLDAEGGIRLAVEHVRAFILGMCRVLGIEFIGSTHGGAIFEIRLTEDIRESLGRRGNVVRLTAERRLANNRAGVEIIDAESPLFRLFLSKAKALDFGGLTAAVSRLDGRAVITAVLRWQSDKGARVREEYAAAIVDNDGNVSLNPESWGQWLVRTATDSVAAVDVADADRLFSHADQAFDRRLAIVASGDLHPEDRTPLTAGMIG